MNNLTLQHISAYLPYNLEVLIQGTHTSSIRNLTNLGFDSNCLYALSQGWVKILDLRPVDSLTDEEFEELGINQEWFGLREWSDISNSAMTIQEYNMLLSMKVDVFSLIPLGLALPIESEVSNA